MSIDRQEGKASIWWITEEELSSLAQQVGIDITSDIEDVPGELRNAELEYLTSREGVDPERGDLLKHASNTYRNALTYIYDGESFVELSHELDDYGSLPPEFTVAEFPPDYWVGRIEHNNIIWTEIPEDVSWENVTEVPEGVREVEPYEPIGRYVWDVNGTTYYLYSDEDEGVEPGLYPLYYIDTHDGKVYTWFWE